MSDRVLVDTSVWIEHIKKTDDVLTKLLRDNLVVVHPFVFGELLLGGMPAESEFAQLLDKTKEKFILYPDTIATMINNSDVVGQGIGLIDTYLLHYCKSKGLKLYTRDGKLATLATRCGCLY
jgi:predicted nucleic acid-binding protein